MDRLNSKMTAIADEIRELNGGNEKLDLDTMANDIRNGNEEIALQRELIEQAVTALNGKVDPELYGKGYEDGYKVGETDGEAKGRAEGEQIGFSNALAKRTELDVTENGEYIPEGENIGFSKVNVSVKAISKLPQVIDKSVTEITMEDLDGITKIGNYAFESCSNLISAVIPDSVLSIGNYAFQSCSSLPDIKIPKSATSLGDSVFLGCSKLKSIDIPDSIIKIGSRTFFGCSSLINLIISDSITSLGEYFVYNCTSLTSLTIPKNVTKIGSSALQCGSSTNKATITFLPTTPPAIQSNTFTASKLNKIIVPKGCGEAYKTATNWSNFADYIEEEA